MRTPFRQRLSQLSRIANCSGVGDGAVDAQDEVPQLERGFFIIVHGGDLTPLIQAYTQVGKLSGGSLELIAGVPEDRVVGWNIGARDVPAEEVSVRASAGLVDDSNQIPGAESATTPVEVREERAHDVVEARCAAGVVANGEVEECGQVRSLRVIVHAERRRIVI